MAETLGSLCDKLTIVKLKQWHARVEDAQRRASLATQERELAREIDDFVSACVAGAVPVERLRFPANKVVDGEFATVPMPAHDAGLGGLIADLARVNCALWHAQENVYAFTSVPPAEKDAVVARLAELNLERNACIDAIDERFAGRLVPTRVGGGES